MLLFTTFGLFEETQDRSPPQITRIYFDAMLVTFQTKAYANITMFGDVAIKLLKLMGHNGTVPSAIEPEDIPSALRRLRTGIAAEKAAVTDEPESEVQNKGEEENVSLRNRALPLIELLEAAEKEQVAVMWHD
jgi:hypothetical protein